MKSPRWAAAAGSALAVSFALSFLHPSGNPRTMRTSGGQFLSGAQIPGELKSIIERKCVDCHSEQTRWPIYSGLFPASWLLEHDVIEARSHLNLSRWGEYDTAKQVELLSELGLRARAGSMPPSHYLLLHAQNKLTPAEAVALYGWTRAERRRLRSVLELSK